MKNALTKKNSTAPAVKRVLEMNGQEAAALPDAATIEVTIAVKAAINTIHAEHSEERMKFRRNESQNRQQKLKKIKELPKKLLF